MKVRDSLVKQQQRSQLYHHRQTKPLTPLKPNEVVRVKHGSQWKPAVVIHRHTTPRSYIIKTADGKILRRNQQHLRPTSEDLTLLNSNYIDDEEVFSKSSNQQYNNNEEISDQTSQPRGNIETTSGTHSRYGRVTSQVL